MNVDTVTDRPRDSMATYMVVWFGQFISTFGSGLTTFALGLWVYQQTQSVTQFAFISLVAILPRLLIGPVAGTYVDRWNRRTIMIVNDAIAGVATLAVVLLLATQLLQVWHIYIVVIVTTIANTFQWPAFAAATTQLVAPEQLGRANGLGQFSQATALVLAPTIAAVLLSVMPLYGVMLIDVLTFLIALGTLAVVRFPSSVSTTDQEPPSIRAQMAEGWHYIRDQPGLVKLLFFFAFINFLGGLISVVLTPLILSFTTVPLLGAILSVSGLGMLAGGITLGVWGGPKQRIHGVLAAAILLGLCLMVLGLQTTVLPFAIALFFAYATIPVINGLNQTIWQLKTPPALQGRVLALSTTLASASLPVAYAVAGPLVERVFSPLVARGNAATAMLSALYGTDPGRGIGLLCSVAGVATVIAGCLAYASRDVRTLA